MYCKVDHNADSYWRKKSDIMGYNGFDYSQYIDAGALAITCTFIFLSKYIIYYCKVQQIVVVLKFVEFGYLKVRFLD